MPAALATGRLTAQERQRIEDLALAGTPPARIARKLNRRPATIHFHMATQGLKPIKLYGCADYTTRGGRKVKHFTSEEDAYITARRLEGLSLPKIARLATERFQHPRTHSTIGTRLRMLAASEED